MTKKCVAWDIPMSRSRLLYADDYIIPEIYNYS